MKILLTMGGTREEIDGVRFITNLSTGRTGRAIAERLSAAGHKVLCLRARGAESPRGRNIRTEEFSRFRDLDAKMRSALGGSAFDAVIHLAAVSDYSVRSIKTGGKTYRPGPRGKIPSGAKEMTISLKRNFKILDRIKCYARKSGKARRPPLLIGFKLTSGAGRARTLEAVKALRAADLVVQNDTEEMKNGHPFHIYRDGEKIAARRGAGELADALCSLLRAERDKEDAHAAGA